jgi:hypothetical protein
MQVKYQTNFITRAIKMVTDLEVIGRKKIRSPIQVSPQRPAFINNTRTRMFDTENLQGNQ